MAGIAHGNSRVGAEQLRSYDSWEIIRQTSRAPFLTWLVELGKAADF